MPAMQKPSDNKEYVNFVFSYITCRVQVFLCIVIRVLFSFCRKNSSKDQSSKTLKQQREEERKAAEASGDTRAWNSLFMRSDTVCFLKLNNLQTMVLVIWPLEVVKNKFILSDAWYLTFSFV